ncbi:putative ribonuclease H-like domain-containing protein [Tanacetum coccineum]
MKCPQHYLTEIQEVILFYNGLDVPTRQILDSRGAVLTKTVADAKTAIQEMAEYSQKWHNGTSRGRNAAIRNQRASIKTLEIQIEQMSKVLHERGFGSLPISTKTNLRDQVKLISTTIEADSNSIHRIGSNQYAVSTGQNSTLLYKSRQMTIPFPSRLDNHYCEEEGNYGPKFMEAYGASHINNTIPRKEKDPGRLKYLKGIAENILVGIGKFTFPIDFIILDMPEDVKTSLFKQAQAKTMIRRYSSYTTSSPKQNNCYLLVLDDDSYPSFLATNADDIAMTAIKIKKFYKKTGRRPRVDGKMHVAFDREKVESSKNCKEALMTIDEGQINWVEQTTDEELNHALMAFTVNNEVSMCSKLCLDSYNALQAKYDELQSEYGTQEAALVAHKLAVKKLESQLKASHKQQSSLNEKLNFQANQIFEKDEKLKKYRRIGMKAVKDKDVLQKIWAQRLRWVEGMGSNQLAEVLDMRRKLSRGIFAFRETDAGNYQIPLYSRFKQVEYKGVPHPLSGDYTPREQEDIDDSLYEYGKHGPQPKSPSPKVSNASSIVFSICPSNDSDGELGTMSNANSIVYSTCQSNDSDGEQGTVSDHSVNDDPISIPSSEQVSTSIQQTTPQVPKPQQTVDPSCAQHVKTPRQPIRTPVSPSPILSYNRQNWNQRMERKKLAFKSTRVIHANVRQATPAWTNSNRVNKANQFTPRPVQLNNIRPNFSTASRTIKTGRVNVNIASKNVVLGTMGMLLRPQLGCVGGRTNHYTPNTNSGPTTDSNVHVFKVHKADPSCEGLGPQREISLFGPSLKIIQELNKWDLVTIGLEVKDSISGKGYSYRSLVMAKELLANNGVAERRIGPLIERKSDQGLKQTPYELFPLGKFDGKSDEGFLVGYSVNSKAFRVYNLVTKRVEVNLHVNFLEEKPNVQGIGHRWMFDLDYLTDSMNYIPVSVQNQANPAGSKEVIDIDVQTEEDADLMVVSSTSLSEKIATKKTHSPRQPSSTPISKSAEDIMTFRNELDALALKHLGPVPTTVSTSTNPVNTGSINLNTAFEEVNTDNTEAISPSADHEEEVFSDADDDEMPEIRIYDKSSEGIFEKASYDDEGIISDFNNLPDEVDVPTNPTLRIHNAHPQSQILGDPNTPVQTRSSLKKITEAHALVSYIQANQRSNHKDQQHCLFACFLSQFEPRKVSEALEDGSWVEAMQEELLQFKLQQVWVLVDLPIGR